MKKKYDIGIIGVWFGGNYGSGFTYYALRKTLIEMGYSVLMICDSSRWHKLTSNRGVELAINEGYDVNADYQIKEFKKLNELCNKFVVGSDQLWNYGIAKGFGKSFYLDFANDDKTKVAYATSFGHSKDFTPEKERPIFSRLMERFSAISMREDTGVKMCEDLYGVRAEWVLDPVFFFEDGFPELTEKARYKPEEPYVLSYILDPAPEKRAFIDESARILNCKKINVMDGFKHNFEKNKQALDLEGTLDDVNLYDLLALIKNAEYVITDSAHGVMMAIIFNKQFTAFGNSVRGMTRFDSILGLLDLKHRMLLPENIAGAKLHDEKIDYVKVNKILHKERVRCREWLKNSLEKKTLAEIITENESAVSELEKKICTGCAACVNICPTGALALKPDDLGFYRAATDAEKCIECSMCLKLCPAIELPENTNTKTPKCYAFIASDKEILYSSSSGGIFPLLAKQTLKQGGAVCGAAWKDDFSVEHILIDKEEDLRKLQKSKYMQSNPGDVYRRIKQKLSKGVPVLFSGCPCQTAGLKAYLGKEYKKLLIVDILCSHAPSPKFFKKYIDEAFGDPGLKFYEFRHKVKGWNSDCLTLTLTLADGTIQVRRGASQDAYQSVYHNRTMTPYHCQRCKYQTLPRIGDLTIGDFWGLSKRDASIDTSEGVSVVLVNNEIGGKALNNIPKADIALMKETPLEWLGGNLEGKRNYAPPSRDKFFDAIKKMPFSKAVDYALNKPAAPPMSANTMKSQNDGGELGFLPLQFASSMSRFHFNPVAFEEHFIRGITTLLVKDGYSQRGIHARLPLSGSLKKGKRYKLNIRFKVKTTSAAINFHIYDSATKKYQVVLPVKQPVNDIFQEYTSEFTPNSDEYDSFMVGSFHLRGEGNYLALEYVGITEM